MHHDCVIRENPENLLPNVLIGCDERAEDVCVLGHHLGHLRYTEQVPLTAFPREVPVCEEVSDGVPIQDLASESIGGRHCYGCLASSREPCEPNYPVTHLVPFRMYPEIGSLFHCDGRVLSGYDHHSAPSSLDDLIDSRIKVKMRATSLSTSRVSSLISSSPFRSLSTTNSWWSP